MDKEYLKKAAEAVHAKFPDNHGFILMAMPFNSKEARLAYISNMDRADAINVLKEWLINCGHEEDWMKHL